MQRQALIFGLVLTYFVANTANLLAKPMYTDFEDVIKKSPTIVVAILLAEPDTKTHKVEIEVTQVLRGTLKPGKHTINYFYSAEFQPGKNELVMFLDEKLSWCFVAEPLQNRIEVADSVLAIRGFYDWNAHFVGPGLLTLDLLKQYLKDGTLEYRFRGQVYFPQPGKADWLASAITINGIYDAVKGKSNVKGLPSLAGFPEQPSVGIGSLFNGGSLSLNYSRSLLRQLEIMGLPEGLDPKTGEFIVRFAVKGPEILTEQAFRDYLGDKSKRGFWSSFKLPCPKEGGGERVLSLELGKSTKSDWDSMQLVGWDQEPMMILLTSCNSPDGRSHSGAHLFRGDYPFPMKIKEELEQQDGLLRLAAKTAAGESVIIAFEFEDGANLQGPFTWSFQTQLPYLLYTRKTKGTLLATEGGKLKLIGNFTPAFDSLGLNKND